MIAVGIDTHKATHVAVALSGLGELLGEIEARSAALDHLGGDLPPAAPRSAHEFGLF